MRLRYTDTDGRVTVVDLAERPITIGRSPEADIVLVDDKASRLHCGIRVQDGDYFIKDLKSKNGTYVNGRRVDLERLQAGDRIRVGAAILTCEEREGPGPDTVLHEVEEEMAHGKGYSTILKEIVRTVEGEEPAAKAGAPEN